MASVTRRGRRLERDKFSIEMQIAALVTVERPGFRTLDETREAVAQYLGVSVDTVRRAYRAWKDERAWGGGLVLELERNAWPDKYRARIANLKQRLAEIKASRGR